MALRLLWVVCIPLACCGQMVEIGVKGGVPLTQSFETGSEFHLGFGSGGESSTRRYTVGPMASVSLPRGLGLEFDALYKRLGFDDTQDVALVYTYTRAIANSWEFPVLGTFRFWRRLPVKPRVAAGAAFRITAASSLSSYRTFPGGRSPVSQPTSNAILDHRSGRGAVIGFGGEVRAGLLRISPEFRYTRWAADAEEAFYLHSSQNQAELFLGFAIRAH